jgi:Flp pilus assembly protein TadD
MIPESTHQEAGDAPTPFRVTRRDAVLGLLFILAVLACYLPSLQGKFLWDDSGHVTRPDLQSLAGLGRIWFEPGATQQYYPLLHTAFWLEHRLWGESVLGYHLLNIGLHGLAAWLLFLLLRRLDSRGALFGALLFALHPVCVESVAWISEQKNTLSAVFALGAVLAYLRFEVRRRPMDYAFATALFVLAVLTKTVTATLPAAVLVLAWWKRGRVDGKRDLLPLSPWLAFGLAAGAFTAWVEQAYIGAKGAGFSLSLGERLIVAGRAPWFYLGKLLWPANLSFVYPRWSLNAGHAGSYLPLLALLGVVSVLVLISGRTRAPLAVGLLYVGMLFPALGFVNVYPFVYSFVADHFQYLPSAAVIAAAGAGLAIAASRLPRATQLGAAATLLAASGAATWLQCRSYSDSETLWRATIARNPDCWMAYENLGGDLLEKGRAKEAEDAFRRAVALNPSDARALNQLGVALLERGDLASAAAEFKSALSVHPSDVDGHINLGVVLLQAGRLDDASAEFEQAIRFSPGNPKAEKNLSNVRMQQGRWEDAVSALRAATATDPSDPSAYDLLATALIHQNRSAEAAEALSRQLALGQAPAEAHARLAGLRMDAGDLAGAATEFQEALRLKPDLAEAHLGLAAAFAQGGHLDEAASELRALLAVTPGDAQAHGNLGAILMQSGKAEEAGSEFDRAIELKPDFAEAYVNRGNLALRQRRAGPAIADYTRALELGPDNPRVRNNLGIALAGAGRIGDAAKAFRRALELDPNYAEARRNLDAVTGAARQGR